MNVNNKMKTPIHSDHKGVYKVLDESEDGTKAIPVVFVQKDAEGGFSYTSDPVPGKALNNNMQSNIESDSEGNAEIVDEDVNGLKAIPIVPVTKNDNGEFEYTTIGGNSDDITVTWDDVQNKPASFPPETHTHEITQVNGLQTELDGKAAANHTHTIGQVEGLQTELDGKADSSHTHTIGQVSGLQDALDDKSDIGHSHTIEDITDLQAELDAVKARLDALEGSGGE